jgi:hypothetical protein
MSPSLQRSQATNVVTRRHWKYVTSNAQSHVQNCCINWSIVVLVLPAGACLCVDLLYSRLHSISKLEEVKFRKEFSFNYLCVTWESSQLSLLDIPLRTNVKGKFSFPPRARCLQNREILPTSPLTLGHSMLLDGIIELFL